MHTYQYTIQLEYEMEATAFSTLYVHNIHTLTQRSNTQTAQVRCMQVHKCILANQRNVRMTDRMHFKPTKNEWIFR